MTSARRLEELTRKLYTEEWKEINDFSGDAFVWRVMRLPELLEFYGFDNFSNDGRLVCLTLSDDGRRRLCLSRWRVKEEEAKDDYDSFYVVDLDKDWVKDYGGGVADNPRLVEMEVSELTLSGLGDVLEDLVKAVS